MAKKILQINFHYLCSKEELLQGALEFARPISDTKGLVWKIWIYNENEEISGGLYLFEDEKSVNDYLSGPIGDRLRSNPSFKDLDIKIFDMMDEHCQITRAPV